MEAPRILKEPVNAEVYMSDGTSFEGTIYLRPARTLPADLSPIEDYLAGHDALIPCRGEAGQLVLVGRMGIVGLKLVEPGARPPGLELAVPMTVTLAGGHRFGGTLRLSQGQGFRMSDSLNDSGEWILMEIGAAHMWIARSHIVRAEAL